MNLLFTICARAGSKGVQGKNISNFIGYPLAYYTLAAYMLFLEKYKEQYNKIELAVNTDSNALIEQIQRTNIEFDLIKRKDSLAGDKAGKLEVIRDTVNKMEEIKSQKYDVIVDLDLTSPLRTAEDIQGVIQQLLEKDKADVSFSVTDSRRLPYFNMVICKDNGYYDTVVKSEYRSRQEAPTCFDMNASIYAYRNSFITNSKNTRVFDGNAVVWEMVDTAVLDIDKESDLLLMEIIAKHYFFIKEGKNKNVFQYLELHFEQLKVEY